VAVTQGREIHAASPELQLQPGERVIVLTPTAREGDSETPAAAATAADWPLSQNGR
jgi:hypothetical protein